MYKKRNGAVASYPATGTPGMVTEGKHSRCARYNSVRHKTTLEDKVYLNVRGGNFITVPKRQHLYAGPVSLTQLRYFFLFYRSYNICSEKHRVHFVFQSCHMSFFILCSTSILFLLPLLYRHTRSRVRTEWSFFSNFLLNPFVVLLLYFLSFALFFPPTLRKQAQKTHVSSLGR